MERTNEAYVLMAQVQVLKLLIDNSDLLIPEVSSDSFSNPKFRSLYQAVFLLRESGETINETSLFREANKIDYTIDSPLVHHIFQQTVDRSNLDGALEALKDAMAKTRIGKTLEDIKELTSSHEPLDTLKVSSLEYTIQETIASSYKQTVSKDFKTLLTDYGEELQERKKGLRYMFNDSFLDQYLTKKAAPGQIITIAGSTGTGKSIYGLYLMSGLVNTDIPCMYFSPEMDEMSTMDRWMAMRHEIPIENWYSHGHEMDAMIKLVEMEKKDLQAKAFRFIDEPDITLGMIQHHIREFKMAYGVDYLIVFVDLITQVREFIDTKGKGNTNLATLIEQGVNKLNVIAKKENVCIIAFAQMNREADSAKVRSIEDLQQLRPTRNNIKNSGAIAERSRTVLSVFRERYYADQLLPNDPEVQFIPDVIEIQVLKQNMGKVGSIGKYNFNGPTFTLHELIENNEEGND